MNKIQSAGGVVLNRRGQVLVVSQRGKSWSLPKGRIEPGEDCLAAARREIYEESGLKELVFVRPLGSYERLRLGKTGGEGGAEVKHLTFFLFESLKEALAPVDPDNPEARWVPAGEVCALLTHPKDQEFFRGVLAELDAKIRM